MSKLKRRHDAAKRHTPRWVLFVIVVVGAIAVTAIMVRSL